MSIKEIAQKFYKRPILVDISISIVLNILLETMARGSIIKCFTYIIGEPGQFFFNTLIILLPLALAMFFRRRFFYTVIVSLVWFGLGFTNSMLLTFRSTPFSAVDFRLISTAIDVFDAYLSPWQMVLIITAFAMAIGFAVMMWRKAPKFEGKRNLISVLIFPAVTALGIFALNYSTANAEEVSFANLAEAYENYGFAYCFSISVVDSGMDTPFGYSGEAVSEITQNLSEDVQTDREPNIIFLQLESFFDVNTVDGLELSENPVPTFQYLKDNYSSGLLTVPCVGAGTANTEFEVLTGMSIQFFGAGEYPFKTALTDRTAESMAYNMSALGYTAQAIHNHRGTFYGRNEVYANLGFDTFTPLEYMGNVEKTRKNWCKDAILTDVIMGALESTEEKDYIFTVSVQAHGQYPTDPLMTEGETAIEARGPEGDSKTQIEYYIQQISEVDIFLGDLIDALDEYDEDVVLILYGDHQPSISYFTEFKLGDRYNTEYVIWSNFSMPKLDRDLRAYQLSAYVQERLGMNSGVIAKYHQDRAFGKTGGYLEGLEMLQYDILFGEGYSYNGPYEPTEITMGIEEIAINHVYRTDDIIYIIGDNFTEFSGVYVDGVEVEVIYYMSKILTVSAEGIEPGQEITVGQRNKDRIVLSYSEPYVY